MSRTEMGGSFLIKEINTEQEITQSIHKKFTTENKKIMCIIKQKIK